MILLSVQGLTRQFDVDPVFHDLEFEVRPGEKIGLVGPNGTGKTTLLKVLAGFDDADVGKVERHPTVDVALLEQEAEFSPDRTLIEEAKSGLAHLYRLQAAATDLAHQMAAEKEATALEKLQRRYDQLQQDLQRQNAYNIDHRVHEVLYGLGFHHDEYDRPLRTFSGGQQNRALLARMLLRNPDLMLLDEPTNHLDIAATEWLEQYLAKSDRAMILVSHDRYFLDRVTNRILELFDGTVNDYKGNFSAYWRQRDERNEVLRRTWEKQQEFIEKTEDFIRRNKYGQKHAQAADREKKLGRLERVELPHDIPQLPMQFGQASRTGDWVIQAKDVAKGFDLPLFENVTLQINRGDRVGILGPNGSGKTTLLRVLLRELPPDAGAVRHGAGVKIGYYDQQLTGVDPERDAVEAIRPPDDPTVTPGPLRSLLAAFGIRSDLALQKVAFMSGGEKSRVALAKIAAQKVNVLVLDEPTNHLDLWARASLEEALKAFDGTLIFVSHDRYFLDRVASRVIVLEADRWREHEGNYSAYVAFAKAIAEEAVKEKEAAATPMLARKVSAAPTSGAKSRERRKRKFPYRKQEDLEAEIAEKEALAEQLLADMADPALHRDGERVKATTLRYEETKAAIERLYEHWEEAVELN